MNLRRMSIYFFVALLFSLSVISFQSSNSTASAACDDCGTNEIYQDNGTSGDNPLFQNPETTVMNNPLYSVQSNPIYQPSGNTVFNNPIYRDNTVQNNPLYE